ncbi:DNA topoisomerase [Tuber borchii]|uniref:DNA topoisomerase 2 n=1 Tax=Tuber borchii TaxID=42251 RepID=A0A2T6ZZ29_TUBBO|nr:DNA topoisomerase [Tuber borchii]
MNGERTKLNFRKYCEMFINALHEAAGVEEKPVITWEVGVLEKQNKSGAAVKNVHMRNHFFIFVNCLIENPAFTSQTKEQLTTRSSAFGSKCCLSDTFFKNVLKNTPVISNIIDYANMKADQQWKKKNGSRRSTINNPKLIDANRAGTKDPQECVLILTEGDSARSLAVAGISAIAGRDRFGVFPLRGKLLNVRDASHDQIMKNVEIKNVKKILGLQHKKVYESRKELRYGHLMIMRDQDYDGSHIKGLLINFFETQFPSLLKLPNFLSEFITPIVKVFKGLGTSGERDAKLDFSDLEKDVKEFLVMEEEGRRLIELAFSKKKMDERKKWL